MSIISEINRINTNIANAYTKAEEKGATLPVAQNSANLADTIDSITSGGGSEPNIFVQLTEPDVKKGIWLQKEATPEHYTYDSDVFLDGEWLPDGAKTDIPFSFSDGTLALVGANVYIFGRTACTKYDTANDTYTTITTAPLNPGGSKSASVDTNIYIFGGLNNMTTAYKYDTLTDTYTQIANIPYNFKLR